MKDSQAIVTPLGVSDASIGLDTPEWFSWLSEHSSFSYQSAICDYTCNKRSNGKWYASKRKGDRREGSKSLAQEYLGADGKLTKAKLEEIARKLALPDRDYWYLKHPKPTKSAEPTEAPGAGCTSNECTTVSELSSQLHEEMAKLRAELERVTQDRDSLLIRISETQARMMHEIKKAHEDADKKNAQLEAYNREIDRANGYLESDNRKLREQIERLQSSSNSPDLEKIRDRILLTQPPKERRKLKTILDQFISQCAT
jgi:hypothetical protein